MFLLPICTSSWILAKSSELSWNWMKMPTERVLILKKNVSYNCQTLVQLPEYETAKTVLFWDFLWQTGKFCLHKFRMCSKASLTLKLWLIFAWSSAISLVSSKNVSILLPLNCNLSGFFWRILYLSKLVGQEGIGAHFKVDLVSQFKQTKFS